MAIVIFDENTDYEALEYKVKDRFSYLQANVNCCDEINMCELTETILAIDINKTFGYTTRYQNAVQSAYNQLFT